MMAVAETMLAMALSCSEDSIYQSFSLPSSCDIILSPLLQCSLRPRGVGINVLLRIERSTAAFQHLSLFQAKTSFPGGG